MPHPMRFTKGPLTMTTGNHRNQFRQNQERGVFPRPEEQTLKEVSYLFGALQDRDVDALMRIGVKERLQVGATLITEGDCLDAIYLILEGALTVSVKGHDTPIASVGKGEVVGE